MKIKKFSFCLLFVLSVFALVSCSNDDKDEATTRTSIDQNSVNTTSVINLVHQLLVK